MRLRRLVLIDLALLLVSLPGLLNVVAKDHVSTAEGVIAWISILALVVSLLGLLALVALGVRRLLAKPS
jgi:uncharacterized membrane protein YhaH (DUF805 family)